MKKTILVLHAAKPPVRLTVLNHITALPRYHDGFRYVFHHVNAPLSAELVAYKFDGVVANYCFMAYAKIRSDIFRRQFEFLRNLQIPKIAIVQDDYTNSEILDNWISHISFDVVYSPIEDNLLSLYPKSFPNPKITFRSGLTGYVDSKAISTFENASKPWSERTLDLGTRVRDLPAYYGRHGALKGEIAVRFAQQAQAVGFVVDVSTDPNDVIAGEKWLHFLANCKFSIGTKGGASMADPTGQIRLDVEAYLEEHPSAGFDELEAECFPGIDEKFIYQAISPRLFECAALESCQILIEDQWPGGLLPGIDYIPLAKDFSNLGSVFDMMRNETLCQNMIASCKGKLVDSGVFDYANFAADIAMQLDNHSVDVTTKNDGDEKLLQRHFKRLQPFEVLRPLSGGYFLHVLMHVLEVNAKYMQLADCQLLLRSGSFRQDDNKALIAELKTYLPQAQFLLAFVETARKADESGPEYITALNKVVEQLASGVLYAPRFASFDACEIWA